VKTTPRRVGDPYRTKEIEADCLQDARKRYLREKIRWAVDEIARIEGEEK